MIIKINSYPSVSKNDVITSCLSQIARLINTYQNKIEIVKYKIIFLGKKLKHFDSINSLFGIREFTTSLIFAELDDINCFRNIKELTAYCGLAPLIKQSDKSINIKGLNSKSGNKCLRKVLFVSILNILSVTSVCRKENKTN